MPNKRSDPSQTAGIRRSAIAETKKRFNKLKKQVRKLIVDQDALGLQKPKLLTNTIWAGRTNPEKVDEFRKWLTDQVSAGILETTETGEPWTNKYIGSAYRRGLVRSQVETSKVEPDEALQLFGMTPNEFLQSSFRTTESVQRLELLYTRAWTDLEGVTKAMETAMSRALTQGLADGLGAREIGRNLTKQVDSIGRNRGLTIARTEIVRAQAEGQLDGFEDAEVLELNVLAEWSTAGDDRVCPQCQPLEDKVFTIKEARSLLPRHPNCRCAWIPANVGEEVPKGRAGRPSAIRKSLKAEGGSSGWKGASLRKKKAPKASSGRT